TPPSGLCSTSDASAGVRGVIYDETRCRPLRELAAAGVAPDDAKTFAVYRFLGKRYRVTYAAAGELPISAARLSFLLDDLPLSVLVSPDGAFINRIMNLGLFRGLVQRQIREVVEDIDGASHALARRGLAAVKGTWTPEERARLQAFLALE